MKNKIQNFVDFDKFQNFNDYKNYLDNQSTKKVYDFEKQKSYSYHHVSDIMPNQEVKSIVRRKSIFIDSKDRFTNLPDPENPPLGYNQYPWDFKVNISSGYAGSQVILKKAEAMDQQGEEIINTFVSTTGASLEEPSSLRNVIKVSLRECIVPDFTAETQEYPYLILQIPELQDFHCGTNDAFRKSFAVLTPERIFEGSNYVTCKTANGLGLISSQVYDPPLAKLSSLSIKFLTPDGELFEWEPNEQNCFLSLIISYLEPNKQFVFKSVPIF